MPQVAAGAAIATAFGVGAGTVTTITGAAFLFGSQLVLGGLARALQKDPDVGGTASATQGRTQTVRESTQPRAVVFGRVRKGGTYALIHTTGSNNRILHLVIALADHECESIGAVYFGDELAIDENGDGVGPYEGLVSITKRLGSDDQSAINIPDVDSDIWGDDHRLRGVAHVYLRLEFDSDAFPNGIPNASFDMEGYNQVWDPRTEEYGYSRNAALCAAAYLTNQRWGLGIDWDDIPEDALIEAANVCDEDVEKADGSTEPRYQCDGLITEDEQPRDIVENLLSAMAGEAVNTGGTWVIHAGAYREPDITYTADDFRGGIKLQTRVSRRENFNTVSGTFISPDNEWEPSDFPEYKSDFYVEQDGRRIARDIELPFTISSSAAQRIAKIELERARREQTLEAPVMLSGILARAGDIIEVDYSRWGFDKKPFEVRELAFSDDDDAMGVDLVLREISPLVYDWDASEEEIIEAAPPTTLPSSRDVPQPITPGVSEELYVTRRSAGVRVRVQLDWSGSETDFVDRFQVEVQQNGGAWQRIPGTEATSLEIRDVEPGQYRFRVRAVNRLGVVSDWATTSQQDIVGTDDPPGNVQGLSVSGIGGMAKLSWDEAEELDVVVGGSFEIRHSRQLENATWSNAVRMGRKLPGSATEATLPLKRGTYLIKKRDAQGQPSPQPAMFVASGGTVLNFANIDEIQEDPSWAGDKTNVEEDGGNLVMEEGETEGVYRFAAGFDFGEVRRFRLQTDIDVSVLNLGQNIDDRTNNIDEWADFDGTADAEVDIQVWVRITDDDPDDDPTWSPWERIDSAEYQARGAQFEIRMSTETEDFLPQVNEMRVFADEVTT